MAERYGQALFDGTLACHLIDNCYKGNCICFYFSTWFGKLLIKKKDFGFEQKVRGFFYNYHFTATLPIVCLFSSILCANAISSTGKICAGRGAKIPSLVKWITDSRQRC